MAAPKVALVHDWLSTYGGAEQVLLALHELFPEAPIYTSVWNREKVKGFGQAPIITSYLQKLPAASRRHQVLIPLMPLAFEAFDLKGYDLVISSTTGLAKGVITHPGQKHLSYCHTPPRYLWHLGGDDRTQGWLRQQVAHRMRLWDVVSAERVDRFLANSETVRARIEKIYRQPATVVYPPVDTGRFSLEGYRQGDYFLSVGRLVGYKRVDILVEACKQLGLPLKVVGEGPEKAHLERLAAGSRVEFLGRVADTELAGLYAGAKAFLFAAEEDFGIVPVEAMSAGKPVIAYERGGLTESVQEGLTGRLFPEQTVQAAAAAIQAFRPEEFNPEKIRSHALGFDREVFKQKIRLLVQETLG